MRNVDVTDQVMSQLEYYAERIAYLTNIGDLKSAEVLKDSAQWMATAADQQDEWVVLKNMAD